MPSEEELKEKDRQQAEIYQRALDVMNRRGCKECSQRRLCEKIWTCPLGKD